MLKNTTAKEYVYDFDDNFQPINDLFHYQAVEITTNNMNSLKEMADDLKIESILPQIDNFINVYEEFYKNIDEQQNTVDSIEEVFNWLFDINTLNVLTVKASILDSKWIKTEDEIFELAVIFIQVIKISINLHPYLIDLLIQLNEDNNKLSILLPFLIKKNLLQKMIYRNY